MIAKVIPIKRLPKHLSEFDYLVPKELESKLKIGQLIEIPFRKSKAFGLVLSIQQKTGQDKLKEIIQITQDIPLLDQKHLDFLNTLSQWYGTSRSNLLKMSLLPLQKNKLKKIELTPIKKPRERKEGKTKFIHYTTEKEHADFLKKNIQGKTLILAPETHMLDEIRLLLPIELQQKAIVWNSELSTKRQFERWMEIRNNEKEVIISTRGGVFLPLTGLKTIIIDYEHEENHKHWDQSPRFHVKDVVQLLSKVHQTKIFLMSFSPSEEAYFNVHKKNYQGKLNLKKTKAKVVNMKDERKGGNFSIFSDKASEEILNSKQDVFILVNRLGYATSVGCNDCGFLSKCDKCTNPHVYHEKTKTLNCHYCNTKKPMIANCPKCTSPVVGLYGLGTELAEAETRKLLGSTKEVFRIDSMVDEKKILSKKPKVIIGTEASLKFVNWKKTELFMLLDIDKQLNIPEYLAQENVWHLIQKINYYKQTKAKLLIQSFHPQHLVFRSLIEPDRFFRTDLNQRKTLLYPPYAFLVRYFYGHGDIREARKEARKIHELLTLTKEQKKHIISPALEMHPRYYRRKFWLGIMVKIPPNSWKKELEKINQIIPENWKIDPNPISLLSP